MKIYNVINVGGGGNNNVMYCTETKPLADVYCAYLNSLNLKYDIYEVKEAVLEDMRVDFLFFDDQYVEIASVHDSFDYEEHAVCDRITASTLAEAIEIRKGNND